MVMGWVRGRLLEMSGSPLLELTSFLATIEEGTNSRKIDGVVTHLWKYRFCLYYLQPMIKTLRQQEQGGKGDLQSPCFSRHFHDWEIKEVMTFLQILQKSSIQSEEEDKLGCKESKSVVFLVKSFFHSSVQEKMSFSPLSMVWNPWVPVKVGFFAGEATWGRILMTDQLKKKGMDNA